MFGLRQAVFVTFCSTISLSLAAQYALPQAVQSSRDESHIDIAVFDESGAVVPQAEVVVSNLHAGGALVGKTGLTGRLSLRLTPGVYEITVHCQGFTTLRQTVALAQNETVPVTATLQIAGTVSYDPVPGVDVYVETEPSSLNLQLIPEPTFPKPHPDEKAPPMPSSGPQSHWKHFFSGLAHKLGL